MGTPRRKIEPGPREFFDAPIIRVPLERGFLDEDMFSAAELVSPGEMLQHFMGFLATSFGIPRYEIMLDRNWDGMGVKFVPPPRGWQYPAYSHPHDMHWVAFFVPGSEFLNQTHERFITRSINTIIHGRPDGRRR